MLAILLALLPLQLACPGTSGQTTVPLAQCDVFLQVGERMVPLWSGMTDTLDLGETE